MKWRVLIRPRAESDLRESRNWYQNQRAGLGDQFIDEINATIQLLTRDPARHLDYYRGFRRSLVRRFPYKIFYRIEDDRVIVFRVLHARRDHPRLLP